MADERWNLDAGLLRDLVTVQVLASAAPDGLGHPVRTWSDLATAPAWIQTPTGRKLESARQLVPQATHEIWMRWRPLDENNHRLVAFVVATNLAAGIDNATTTVTVGSAACLPIGHVIWIEAEQMKVTAIAGASLTVVRGVNGTVAVAHANEVIVRRRAVFGIGNVNDVDNRRVKLILTCTELKGPSAL